MKKLLTIFSLATVSFVFGAFAQAQDSTNCRAGGIFESESGSCHTESQIAITIDYPQALVESSPLIQQTIDPFLREQQMALFSFFVDYPYEQEDVLTITQQTYRHSESVVSIVFHTYSYIGGSARGNTEIKTFTFDLSANTVLSVEDLFAEDVDAWAVLVPMISESLAQQDAINLDPQTRPAYSDAYAQFALDETTLYFFFPKYGEGPVPAGSVTVGLPLSSLESLLRTEYRD